MRSLAATLVAALAVVWGAIGFASLQTSRADRVDTAAFASLTDAHHNVSEISVVDDEENTANTAVPQFFGLISEPVDPVLARISLTRDTATRLIPATHGEASQRGPPADM